MRWPAGFSIPSVESRAGSLPGDAPKKPKRVLLDPWHEVLAQN
jgi:hypothetical protein